MSKVARGPDTSQQALDRLVRNLTLYTRVLHQCAKAGAVGKGFTDDWLARELSYARNITARVRLEVERDGWIYRRGTVRGASGVEVTMFYMAPEKLELYEMTTKVVDRG